MNNLVDNQFQSRTNYHTTQLTMGISFSVHFWRAAKAQANHRSLAGALAVSARYSQSR